MARGLLVNSKSKVSRHSCASAQSWLSLRYPFVKCRSIEEKEVIARR